jgi:hypothetical protein
MFDYLEKKNKTSAKCFSACALFFSIRSYGVKARKTILQSLCVVISRRQPEF